MRYRLQQELGLSLGTDVLELSYLGSSSNYCFNDPLSGKPLYSQLDTCNGVNAVIPQLDALTQKIDAQFNSPNYVIVGHSLGGLIASTWAVRQQGSIRQRIKAVVTLDSMMDYGIPSLGNLGVDLVSDLGWPCNATQQSLLDIGDVGGLLQGCTTLTPICQIDRSTRAGLAFYDVVTSQLLSDFFPFLVPTGLAIGQALDGSLCLTGYTCTDQSSNDPPQDDPGPPLTELALNLRASKCNVRPVR